MIINLSKLRVSAEFDRLLNLWGPSPSAYICIDVFFVCFCICLLGWLGGLVMDICKSSSETARLPKEVIDTLRDQVFGFDTFFVTGQEPYEVRSLRIFYNYANISESQAAAQNRYMSLLDQKFHVFLSGGSSL